jgi:hypothetical protein
MKNDTLTQYSGSSIKYNQIRIFNKNFDINKKNGFSSSDISSKKVFSIPYIIDINKIEEYEKNDIIYTYDAKTAVSYAKSIVEDEFLNNKLLEKEKILRIEELVVTETNDSFEVVLLIKKIESIGEFKKKI